MWSDRKLAFSEIADLMRAVDAPGTSLARLAANARELAHLACRFVTGSLDPYDLMDFHKAVEGDAGAVERIAASNRAIAHPTWRDADTGSLFGTIAASRAPLARLVMARHLCA